MTDAELNELEAQYARHHAKHVLDLVAEVRRLRDATYDLAEHAIRTDDPDLRSEAVSALINVRGERARLLLAERAAEEPVAWLRRLMEHVAGRLELETRAALSDETDRAGA